MVLFRFSRYIVSTVIFYLLSTCIYAESLVFTQLSSLKNQAALSPINLASLEIVSGVENIGNAPTSLSVSHPGYYFVIAAGQGGPIKSGQGASGDQYVDIWFLKNGAPIPNSTSRISVGPFMTGTVITQNIIPLNANDTISVGFSASDPSYGLVALPAKGKGGQPAITSLTLTAYKL